MIIDFHTHIFPDGIAPKTIPFLEQRSGIQANTDGMLKGLLRAMEETNVDVSVVHPVVTKPSQFDTVNQFAKMVNDSCDGKVISFGGIHPDCEDYKGKLEYIKELGLPGIKLHPDYQGVFIDDERYMKIIEYADALDLMILTHAGMDIGLPDPVHCPPDRMRKVIDAIHPKKLIVAHLGGWRQWEDALEHLIGENIYLDTAFCMDYISEDLFLKIWEKHDKDKLLFATDSPWGEAKKTVKQLKKMPLSEEEIKDILANNAKKLLGLS